MNKPEGHIENMGGQDPNEKRKPSQMWDIILSEERTKGINHASTTK